MAAIIRNSFRTYNAKKFIAAVDPVNGVYANSLYLGIGRPQPWDNEPTPEVPANNFKDDNNDWADLMFLKRLFSTNMCHCVPKRVWSANSLYDNYRHDWNGYVTDPIKNVMPSEIENNGQIEYPTDLSQVKFYCISPTSNKIYICLRHAVDNAGVIAASTINPDYGTNTVPGTAFTSNTNTNIKYCSDGYVWLLLADSTDLMEQFETVDYMPVQTATDISTGNSATQYTWQTNADAYKGGIYSINVTNGGVGGTYNGNATGSYKITSPETGEVTLGAGTPHVQVLGDGTGLEFVVFYNAGKVEKIVVTNPGSGYSWATVNILNAGGTGATAEAILTPLGGLATDPVKTLSAYNVVIQTIMYDDENTTGSSINHGADFTIANDFRKICLVSNPIDRVSGNLAEANKLDMTTALIGSGTLPAADTILTNGNCRVRVVDSGTTAQAQSIVRVIQTHFDIPTPPTNSNTDIVTGTYGGFTASSLVLPDAVIGSGDIIYTDYRRAVARAASQSEEVKIVIEF